MQCDLIKWEKVKINILGSDSEMKSPKTSIEYSEIVNDLYISLLNRKPDEIGLSNAVQQLNSGTDLKTIISNFISSAEFNLRNNELGLLWKNIENMQADITIFPEHLGYSFKLTGPSTDQSVFRDILHKSGLYEEHISSFLQEELKPGQTFLDIGANLGYFSVLAGKLVGETGSVISFEPSPHNFHYLTRNTQDNQTPGILYNLGVWNEPTTLLFESARWSLGSSRILFNGERSSFADIETKIDCIPLDELNLPRFHLMKMDIEGAEPFALKGMEKTILKYKPTMIMEINRYCLRNYFNADAADIFNTLKKWGYTWNAVEGDLDIPEDGICDIVARPK